MKDITDEVVNGVQSRFSNKATVPIVDKIKVNKKKSKRRSPTWCGFPHHLLVPRSKDYDENDSENLGGQDFGLFAIVTDVDEDVVAGSDNVEHMICGHREIKTKLDGKPHGFPFDRNMDFKLTNELNSVATTHVKIMFTSLEKLPEIGRKLERMGGHFVRREYSSEDSDDRCRDTSLKCPRWAKLGVCQRATYYKHAKLVRRKCQKSCKLC